MDETSEKELMECVFSISDKIESLENIMADIAESLRILSKRPSTKDSPIYSP